MSGNETTGTSSSGSTVQASNTKYLQDEFRSVQIWRRAVYDPVSVYGFLPGAASFKRGRGLFELDRECPFLPQIVCWMGLCSTVRLGSSAKLIIIVQALRDARDRAGMIPRELLAEYDYAATPPRSSAAGRGSRMGGDTGSVNATIKTQPASNHTEKRGT